MEFAVNTEGKSSCPRPFRDVGRALPQAEPVLRGRGSLFHRALGHTLRASSAWRRTEQPRRPSAAGGHPALPHDPARRHPHGLPRQGTVPPVEEVTLREGEGRVCPSCSSRKPPAGSRSTRSRPSGRARRTDVSGPPRTFEHAAHGPLRPGPVFQRRSARPSREIQSFAAYVGGSPTDVCVGARRLGLNTALLTAVGDDLAGDFMLAFLRREGVEDRLRAAQPGFRTGAALLAGSSRRTASRSCSTAELGADVQLDLADVAAAPIADSRVLQLARART